ncbi:MAG: hypothetical protein ACKO27_04465 [Ilumatobacteraceae bacterium]
MTRPVSSIHQREQTQLARTRLGRIGTMATDAGAAGRHAGTLRFLAPQPAAVTGRFPVGCRTRRLEASNRIKLQLGERGLADLLGWADGALDVVIADGWALVSQRPEQQAATRGRNSAYAAFTIGAGGVERIGLRPRHLDLLGVAAGDELLVAALPDHGALVLCDPDLIAALAPTHIARLLIRPDEPAAGPAIAAGSTLAEPRIARTGGIR